MNENIDLTKILKGCPVGTEFYSSVHGKLAYLSMYVNSSASIITFTEVNSRNVIDDTPISVRYYRDGRLYPNEGECTVFPSKDQRDWSKFERFWDKPKVERFDIKTMKPFDKALVRCHTNDKWAANFFVSCDSLNDVGSIECMNLYASQCIPYNDKTKHLLGTKEDCPEYYKWWEE